MKTQIGKAKPHFVHAHELVAENHAANAAKDQSARHDGESKFKVMKNDGAVGEAERLEDGDLLTLQIQQARKHRVGHERGHAEKHERETNRERFEHADFIGHADVRRVILPAIRAAPAVDFEQTIHLRDDRALGHR